ncbi:hypothetical protein [Paenarthrobacter sp. YJN-5]|uniref:hypothetical protein n=1 Tax=Paenarthrobacter sp. YJN-5 TaxID=2735316 RepID=UPI0018781A34|nr:hypothetical protein [Paenarthrobacter sp. YJN-5]QOT19743.1 hypothetical protein HMI59_24085 [Paenarthrobacter sp. YJN-5]
MDFPIPDWAVNLSPWALVVSLVIMLARGTLTRPHTDRVEADADKRIAEAKEANDKLLKAKDEAHAAALAAKDATVAEQKETITYLRGVVKTLTEAVETIAETQEEQNKTTDIVKTVMQTLQANAAKPKDPTGPLQKVKASP